MFEQHLQASCLCVRLSGVQLPLDHALSRHIMQTSQQTSDASTSLLTAPLCRGSWLMTLALSHLSPILIKQSPSCLGTLSREAKQSS